MRNLLRTAGTFAVLALATAALAQDSWTIAYNMKKGDVFKTKTNIKAQVMGLDLVIEQLGKEEVTEVKDDGSFTVKSSMEGGKVNVMGMDQEIPAADASTSTRTKLGKLVKQTINDMGMSPFSPEITQLMGSMNEPLFSDKAVKAGDTYTVTLDNPAVKSKKVEVKVTIVGAEKVNGKDAVKVKQVSEAVVDDKGAKMKVDITAWIDPKNGRAVKVEGKVSDIPANFGGTMSFEVTQVERT